MDPVEIILFYVGVPVMGLLIGGLILSRVLSWLQAMVTAHRFPEAGTKLAAAAVLHSGPWLLAGIAYWAYHVLSAPHGPAWDWFFGAMAVAIPVVIVISAVMGRRDRRGRSA